MPHPLPSSGWLRSIDAVYDLFEQPHLAAQYPHLATNLRSAVRLCEQVIHQVGWHRCALSFNGGKDCTVLVHILSAVRRRLLGLSSPSSSASAASSSSSTPSSLPSPDDPTYPLPSIPALYIACPSPFPTVEKFIAFSASPTHGYNLDLVTVQGGMKEGLRLYLDGGGDRCIRPAATTTTPPTPPATAAANEQRKPRDIQSVFIGTRRDDPHGPSLSPRSWTDADWPRVERIHPILSWSYRDVWDFLRCPALANPDFSSSSAGAGTDGAGGGRITAQQREELARLHGVAGGADEGVPYCLLYEQGYTSLGSTYNTRPNPVLSIGGGEGGQSSASTSAEAGTGAGLSSVVVGDGTARGRWKPAYMLQDGSLERAGREKGLPSRPQVAS
ncbi:3'-phosphoadenosine 5'-phosphosulfate sulfotransferase [Thecaphora frezii]